jgi:hypothetical protein
MKAKPPATGPKQRRAATWRTALLALALPLTAMAQDVVIRVERNQFRPEAGRITFSEVPPRTANPVYPPQAYGGGADSPTVRFGGHFQGRRVGAGDCPPGAMPTGCLGGAPSAPLRLAAEAPPTFTMQDGPRGLVLVGTPGANGPIAVWFDRDMAAVGLDGGHFDAIGGTAITVYDRQGRQLGRTVNRSIGQEFLGLATRDLSPRIAGLEFHLVGPEPAGFGIDNLRFGAPEQVNIPGVRPPEPQRAEPPPPPPPPPPRPPEPPRRPPMLP